MKKRMISFLIISSLIFAFIIFYKGLNKSSFYNPKSEIENIPQFFTNSFYSKEEIDSKKIFDRINFIFLIYGLHGVYLVETNTQY